MNASLVTITSEELPHVANAALGYTPEVGTVVFVTPGDDSTTVGVLPNAGITTDALAPYLSSQDPTVHLVGYGRHGAAQAQAWARALRIHGDVTVGSVVGVGHTGLVTNLDDLAEAPRPAGPLPEDLQFLGIVAPFRDEVVARLTTYLPGELPTPSQMDGANAAAQQIAEWDTADRVTLAAALLNQTQTAKMEAWMEEHHTTSQALTVALLEDKSTRDGVIDYVIEHPELVPPLTDTARTAPRYLGIAEASALVIWATGTDGYGQVSTQCIADTVAPYAALSPVAHDLYTLASQRQPGVNTTFTELGHAVRAHQYSPGVPTTPAPDVSRPAFPDFQ